MECLNEITNLINNVGFPIFVCIYLVKNNEKLVNSFTELTVTLKGIDTRLEILEERSNKGE